MRATQTVSGKRLRIRGLVQGVGFRPMVWQLARQHHLSGRVLNDGDGVLVEIFGNTTGIRDFTRQLPERCPPLARIEHIDEEDMPAEQHSVPAGFSIENSRHSRIHTGIVPDAACCPECLADTGDRNNRRYRYAFTNCTHCGPRLSIIRRIPYDRANTSMADFSLCPSCHREYTDPADRRFHAQPTACPDCGPRVWLHPEPADDTLTRAAIDSIDAARILLQQGYILAIKGIGGYHLACDAGNREAVKRLRRRKQRYAKPFALMARDIRSIEQYCCVSHEEAALLQSSAAPVVLLEARSDHGLPEEIAPRQRSLGFMLPYTPLHHLLLKDLERPLVMTSANISHNPQCTGNAQAEQQLAGIADYWLHNDRDILNRLDDSVARVIHGRTRLLRRARGYAPAPLTLPAGFPRDIELLACGAELKNTFCLVKDGQAILSQHMGDLENAGTLADYEKNLALYQQLFAHRPQALAVDAHPEYLSSKLGRERADRDGLPLIEVQHHHAHIAACLAENAWPLRLNRLQTEKTVLGISLDGLGYGDDGSLWGGEFLLANYTGYRRAGSFRAVAMPGGTQAIIEPWRNTYAQLAQVAPWQSISRQFHALELVRFLSQKPLATFDSMIRKGLNAPLASSCGRLFDAVAAAVGISREQVSYEGQAAIELEALVTEKLIVQQQNRGYLFTIETGDDCLPRLQTRPMWRALLIDLLHGTPADIIATRFHLGLARAIVNMVNTISSAPGLQPAHRFDEVALSGGVFQNRVLFEQVAQLLDNAGYHVLSHSRVPANDGGIALGQAVIALAQLINHPEFKRTGDKRPVEKTICV